jgi:hypothetical protein
MRTSSGNLLVLKSSHSCATKKKIMMDDEIPSNNISA